ncbi:fatty acid desaturase [Comamonas sp. JC664]|uniref:fatty acid desaturase family protein n=1 Tax=Comamonas sp. JC664 TaxID=2801917 RepID=UPI001749F48A|nr:fatty acid desaturase [Comamonas sp. JC664]MBL0692127.1 fatty acid desaturase [Comamonas sp. JC664]GHG99477.1 fatty acid desaturase [Comamonas sp. KCTC 72670]
MRASISQAGPIPVDDPRKLRAELRRVMPPESFQPQPLRGIVALGVVPVMGVLMWAVASGRLPWWACLLGSFALGQMATSVGLAAHEALHHAVFRSRALESLLGWVGFGPFLVTPGTWRAWHVQAHHSAANVMVRDPDILPRQSEWRTQWFAKVFHAMSPGSGSPLSFVSFFFFFMAQGQAFLWHHSALPQFQHVHMHRTRERILTVLLLLGWVAVGWMMGPRGALYAIILPLLIGNFTLMIYIATNHWLLAAHEASDNPFVNTASVVTHPAMDWMHFNFSHHQEHHIFPAMSPKFAPLLRQRLRELNPEASQVYPHLHALRMLYRRPALYAEDGQSLMGKDGSPLISTEELRRQLKGPEAAAS